MSLCTTVPNLTTSFVLPLKTPTPRISRLASGHLSLRCAQGGAILSRKRVNDDVLSFEQRTQKFGASLVAGIISISVAVFGTQQVSSAQMLDTQQGKAIFQKACIGCHYEGGNVLQSGATLTARDLERNGVATEENIFKITYNGKGRMPGFGEKCTPKGQCTFGPRLSDEDIHLLAEYVKLQADEGWPKLERT